MNNRQRAIIIGAIVTFALTACAPTVAGLRTGEFAVQHYDLQVDNATVEAHDQGYTVERDDIITAVTMTNRSFDVVLINKTAHQAVLSIDESAASIRGLSSRLLPGGTSWLTRHSSKPDAIILPNASVIETFYPESHAYFSQGIQIRPFLDGTADQVGEILLSLALTVDGAPAPLLLRFTPKQLVTLVARPSGVTIVQTCASLAS